MKAVVAIAMPARISVVCGNKKNSMPTSNNCSDVIVALGWGWAVESKN